MQAMQHCWRVRDSQLLIEAALCAKLDKTTLVCHALKYPKASASGACLRNVILAPQDRIIACARNGVAQHFPCLCQDPQRPRQAVWYA